MLARRNAILSLMSFSLNASLPPKTAQTGGFSSQLLSSAVSYVQPWLEPLSGSSARRFTTLPATRHWELLEFPAWFLLFPFPAHCPALRSRPYFLSLQWLGRDRACPLGRGDRTFTSCAAKNASHLTYLAGLWQPTVDFPDLHRLSLSCVTKAIIRGNDPFERLFNESHFS